MAAKYINLACGPVFIDNPNWANFDFVAASGVQQANLLGRLPLTDNAAQLIYSSHFLEHIPKPQVESVLRECLRVLQPSGVIRLVLPDLENMARTYLQLRDECKHEQANFLVLEMIDQCVRRQSGGELGKYYRTLQEQAKGDTSVSGDNTVMIDFIRHRTGEQIGAPDQSKPAVGGGGGCNSAQASAQSCSTTVAAVLDSSGSSGASTGIPRTKCQLGRGGRKASLAMGLPPVAASARSGGLHFSGAPFSRQQRNYRFPILPARSRRRRASAQRGRIDVYRGTQATVNTIPMTLSRGECHD